MQLKGTIAFKDQFFFNFFSLLCQIRYYYVKHSIQEHFFQNVETIFFFKKFILKLNSFTAKVWTANYNKSPQITLKVFFLQQNILILEFQSRNHLLISVMQGDICYVSLTKLDCEWGKMKRGRALRLKSNRNLALSKRILRNSTRKGNWKNVTKMDKGLW